MESKSRWSWLRFFPALAGPVVVSFVAPAALGAPKCPEGERPSLSGCTRHAPELRRLPPKPVVPAAGAKDGCGKPSNGPTTTGAHAPCPDASLRPTALLERADRRLLVEEIVRLERLVRATTPKSPDRPMLLMRLAGAYAELAAQAEREHTELEIRVEEQERSLHSTPPANAPVEHAPEVPHPPRRGYL